MGGIAHSWIGAPAHRASDEERERAARSLRRHYAAGRLELHELEERLDRAWHALSRRELAALFRDLPSDRRGRMLRGFDRFQRALLKVHAAGYVTVNGGLVGIWSLTGGGEFWPAWALVPGTTVLAWHAGATYTLSRALTRRRSLTQ